MLNGYRETTAVSVLMMNVHKKYCGKSWLHNFYLNRLAASHLENANKLCARFFVLILMLELLAAMLVLV